MSPLFLSPLGPLADTGQLLVRVLVGLIMFAHGVQKLTDGPGGFATGMLAPLGVPAPEFFAYVVTFVELIGGALLIVGLLSRLSALLLAFDLIVAIVLVKLDIGLIAPMGAQLPGAELDLALIAGFLSVLFTGPGRFSLDHALGMSGVPEPERT